MYVVRALTFAIIIVILLMLVCDSASMIVTLASDSSSAEQPNQPFHPFSFRGKSLNNDSDAEHEYELTQALNLQRQEHVQRECDLAALPKTTPPQNDANDEGNRIPDRSNDYEQQMAGIPDDQLRHLLIDEKHKFLYCYVPKVSELNRVYCKRDFIGVFCFK